MTLRGDLGKFRQKALEEAEKERRAICSELFKSVVMDTPVDTGRARGNWQITTGSPNRNITDRLSPGFSSVVSQELQNLGALGDTVYMTNNLPYIEGLEYGSSGQAPSGMVRKNVARIRSLIQRRRLSR